MKNIIPHNTPRFRNFSLTLLFTFFIEKKYSEKNEVERKIRGKFLRRSKEKTTMKKHKNLKTFVEVLLPNLRVVVIFPIFLSSL